MTPRVVRLASRLTLAETAAAAGVSSPTVRLFEADPVAVRADKRAALSAYYQELEAKLSGDTSTPPRAA